MVLLCSWHSWLILFFFCSFCWCLTVSGDIPAATAEDVELAVNAAQRAFSRNRGRDWAAAPGAVRAKYLHAIAAKVSEIFLASSILHICLL